MPSVVAASTVSAANTPLSSPFHSGSSTPGSSLAKVAWASTRSAGRQAASPAAVSEPAPSVLRNASRSICAPSVLSCIAPSRSKPSDCSSMAVRNAPLRVSARSSGAPVSTPRAVAVSAGTRTVGAVRGQRPSRSVAVRSLVSPSRPSTPWASRRPGPSTESERSVTLLGARLALAFAFTRPATAWLSSSASTVTSGPIQLPRSRSASNPCGVPPAGVNRRRAMLSA